VADEFDEYFLLSANNHFLGKYLITNENPQFERKNAKAIFTLTAYKKVSILRLQYLLYFYNQIANF
jgi:hypothetical protein